MTCTIATDLIVDGKRFTKDPVPFLEAFIWQEGEWRLASEGKLGRPEWLLLHRFTPMRRASP